MRNEHLDDEKCPECKEGNEASKGMRDMGELVTVMPDILKEMEADGLIYWDDKTRNWCIKGE